jgi:hypothetical protein
MNNDDLYYTNRYVPTNGPQQMRTGPQGSSSIEYKRLIDAKNKASNTYRPNNPPFTDKMSIDRRSGIDLMEDSPGFDQYLRLSSLDKNKKIKKTIVNIDSRNRQQVSYYNKIPIVIRNASTFINPDLNKPFYFVGNSLSVYLLLETQYTNSIKNKQFVINSIPEDDIFIQIGLDKELLLFNTFNSSPIFNVDEFYYDPSVDLTTTNRTSNVEEFDFVNNIVRFPEPNDTRYKYNMIKFTLETNIDSTIIKHGFVGDERVIINFCEDMKVAYPNTSHYIMNLGKTFSNIYAIRLLSTEIPNASYTFTGNKIESSFGKMKLSTQVNNRLRWINKTDSIKQLNYHVLSSSFYNKYENTSLIQNEPSQEQLDNFTYLETLYNPPDTGSLQPFIVEDKDTINKYERLASLNAQLLSIGYNINKEFTKTDQYSINFIGNFTGGNSIEQATKYVQDTIFQPHTLLHPYYNEIFESHTFYMGQFHDYDLSGSIIDASGTVDYYKLLFDGILYFIPPDYNTLIRNLFIFNRTNSTITISINVSSTNQYSYDWVAEKLLPRLKSDTYGENNFPLRVQFHSLDNVNISKMTTYIFDIVDIGSGIKYFYKDNIGAEPYRVHYTFKCVPIYGDYSDNKYLFNPLENIVMTVWNPISENVLSQIQKNNPYLYRLFRMYYLQTNTQCYTENINSEWSDISENKQWLQPNSDYSGNITDFLFNFKTWNTMSYKFASSLTTPPIGYFSIDSVNNLLYLNYIDNNNINNDFIIRQLDTYDYISVFPFYFRIVKAESSVDISNQVLVIKYNNTNYNIVTGLTGLASTFIDGSTYEFNIQEYDFRNVQSIYFLGVGNIATSDINGIMRISEKDIAYNFIDFFMGKVKYFDASNNTEIDASNITLYAENTYYHYIDIRYKYQNNFINDNSGTEYVIYLFEESHKTYMRNTLSNYNNLRLDHYGLITYTSASVVYLQDVNILNGYQPTDALYPDTENNRLDYGNGFNVIPRLYNQIAYTDLNDNEFVNMSDTYKYNIIALSKIKYNKGLTPTQYALEYIESENIDSTVLYPAIDKDTNKVILPYVLDRNDIIEYTRYPVYELDIQPAKYSENLFSQYFNANLNNIHKKYYNYQEEIFTNDQNTNETINLNYETDNQSECRMVCLINRNANSLQFTYYRKIFEASSLYNTTLKNYIHYNEGVPFIYFKIPNASVTNGSFVFVDGAPSTDNINSTELNKEHRVIVPNNYRIYVRQLLPLPNIDYLNNEQNLFANEGYIKNDLNVLYNAYTNYVNASLHNDARKDVGFEYIMDRLFGISETNYANSFDNNKLVKQQGSINNENTFYTGNLQKIYSNNYGTNKTYKTTSGYDDQSYVIETRNKLGLEYAGSALVNNANNGRVWNEFSSSIHINKGYQTSFLHGECFVRLRDLYQNQHSALLGRITHSSEYSDENGNISIDYDLFSDTNSQFNICDIVIGLDSQTIGVILPYDYNYSQLPNLDVKLLGLGTYIIHTQFQLQNTFFDFLKSIDNLNTNAKLIAEYFIKEFYRWTIQKNKTLQGFYIQISNSPNTSRLNGIQSTNLIVYVPEFFKFLEGDDTPLPLFGFKNTKYNNEFNYFKDNFSPYLSSLIYKSYVMDFTSKDIVIIFEMKETNDFKVNDTIYIENHDIINNSLNSCDDFYYNVNKLQPFSKYITQLETIYNTEIANYNGKSKVISYKPADYNNDNEYFYDYTYTLDQSLSTKVPIPFKNKYIAHNLRENRNVCTANYTLFYYNFPPNENYSYANVFKIDYTYTNGLKLYFNNDLSSDILDNYRNETVDINIRIMNYDDIINQRYVSYYYKPYNSTVFYKNLNTDIELIAYNKYYIQIVINRNPVVFKTKDASNSIIEYDTLGIFERIMNEWMSRMMSIYEYDINKANYFNSRYNQNIFKNRILKLKVSPIDNKGFSYEPVTGGISTGTNGINREVKGYSRKLFPYAEYTIYNTYDKLNTGEQINPLAYAYYNYLRPMQKKSNKEEDAKLFLPGMGVYIVNETISDNITDNLPATAYNYNTKFIGYVLDTSVHYDNNEWFRDYMLNSSTYSNIDISNSITSEYYMYVLVDEDIQTSQDMDELYDALDKDYNHIIFDATAKDNEVISIDGIMGNNLAPYAYDYTVDPSTNIVTLGSLKNGPLMLTTYGSYSYFVRQNIYGNTRLIDTSDNSLDYYEDPYIYNLSNIIPSSNVDGLLGLSTSNIIINRNKANKTLPFYNYQTRLACATIVERPVVKDVCDNKLFITAEYDYFYKNYMKDKTVMGYTPLQSKESTEYLNRNQIIDEYARPSNFKSNNYKEIDCHNGYIDSFRQQLGEFYNGINYKDVERISLVETNSRRSFDTGDDIIFIESIKNKPIYNTGPDYGTINKTALSQLDSFGIDTYNIKVLLGNLVPRIYIDNNRFINSSWNDLLINNCILDYDYYKNNIENLENSQLLVKSCGFELDIIGNKSTSYNQSIDLDKYQYSFFNADQYIEYDNYYGSYMDISSISYYSTGDILNPTLEIDLEDPYVTDRLIDCIIVTYPHFKVNNGEFPNYSIEESELAIINDISMVNISNNIIRLQLENRLTNTYNINNKLKPYDNPQVSIPYRTYLTGKTATLNEFSNTTNISAVSSKFYLPESNVICIIIRNDLSGANMYHKEQTFGDKLDIIMDYGKTRKVDYNIEKAIPYTIDDISGTSHTTTAFLRTNLEFDNRVYNPYIYDYKIDVYDASTVGLENRAVQNIYGAYHNGNKYPVLDGINNVYYDTLNDGYVKSYKKITTNRTIEQKYTYDLNGVAGEIINVYYDQYKYASLTYIALTCIDIVFDINNAPDPVVNMGQYILFKDCSNSTIYLSDGFTWNVDTGYLGDGLTFVIDNSASFYNRNIYVYDDIDLTFLPLYEADVYRHPLYYDFFIYDKVDYEIKDISTADINSLSCYTKVLDLSRNILYNVVGDVSGKTLIKYEIPDKTRIRVHYDLSANGSTFTYTQISREKIYFTDTKRFYNINLSDFEIDNSGEYVKDFYDAPLYNTGSGIYEGISSEISVDASGVFLVQGNAVFDVSGYNYMTERAYNGDKKTYTIRGYDSYEYGLTYLSYDYDISKNDNTFKNIYPLYADSSVYDILTDDQRVDIINEHNQNNFLIDGQLIIDYSGQYYRYDSSNNIFNEISGVTVPFNKNIYIYGKYSGHHGMLFKNNDSNMVYSQYYSDINVYDFYQGPFMPDSYYIQSMEMSMFDKILWLDTNDYSYYLLYINSSMDVLDLSATLFNTQNISIFIEGEHSAYRGQTFYLTNSSLCNRMEVAYTDVKVPVYYPENSRLIALTNPFYEKSTSTISEYNGVATQPFLSNNEWYTRIAYRGTNQFIGRHIKPDGNIDSVFSDINSEDYNGGGSRYNQYESHNIFIGGVKGINIPYNDISPPQQDLSSVTPYYLTTTNTIMKPLYPDYYNTETPLIEDYAPYLVKNYNNRKVFGEFIKYDKNYNIANSFVNTKNAVEYNYVTVKGLYFGYGGSIQERHSKDDINSVINNKIGLSVRRVTNVADTQLIYTQVPLIYYEYFKKNGTKNINMTSSKARNRLNELPYDLQFNYIDKLFENTDQLTGFASEFGLGGRIVKKSITTPYNLNPNNYVFLVIPDLNYIEPVQNKDIPDNAFAKILLPGDSNRILYNTYVSTSKVYYDYLFNNLKELEIAFVTNSGDLFDFNGSDHSFTLEITEIIDKLEYVNPRFGNIEF